MSAVADEQRHLDRDWLTQHLVEERHEADLLGEIREAIFGAQDGVTSILIVVITVATATTSSYAVLIAGIAAAIAEIISMAAGEYMSSRSQRQLFLAQIEREREEVRDRPGESEAEVALLLEQEGLAAPAAKRVAAELAQESNVLLKTMVEKELGITVEAGPGALQGALVLAITFAIAALIPIAPFFFFDVPTAMKTAIGLSAVAMFVLGVVKGRVVGANPVVSGLEIVALVAFASLGGYVVGGLLPRALGAPSAP
ncbi:MAG TPA: VIT1/CCC1 transporter family protein [Candidatus Acidoferrales bacterium]|nr:VIT1/CCC1 transporter family protein [Candidatus Acidoferrales bacterium]